MTKLARTPQLTALALMIVLLASACKDAAAPIPTPPPSAPGVASGPGIIKTGSLTALGTILPAQMVKLSFSTGGPVQVVKVQVGMQVKAGEALAELDTTDLGMDVQEAEDSLALYQASLDQARAGAREQELLIARAEYERTLAQHEHLLDGARPEEIAIAQADYQAALARYKDVLSGSDDEDLIVAAASVEKAAIVVQRAQAEYDAVAVQPDVGISPQAAALHEATIDYQAAVAEYERLKSLPRQASLDEMQAQVDSAEARLRLVESGPTQSEITASESDVTIAQARLHLNQAGARPEDVAVALARVQQARTALARAQLALSKAKLLAPFEGTVSAVFLSPGEWGAPGVPVVELLDTSHWRVETRNVGELSIGRVQLGQEATVRVMAFPGKELRGRIVTISPVAVVQQGDTTYTLLIELEPTELNLRPGMNTEVEILTE
jgi:HlyD family secretion protein